MRIADEQRLSAGQGKYVAERDFKRELRAVAAPLTHEANLRLDPGERAIKPMLTEWPRIGPVDLVFRHLHGGELPHTAAAFIELKWARSNPLWWVAWDLIKSALVARLGLAQRALCIVGARDSKRGTPYDALLETEQYDMQQFLCDFHDTLCRFCFREPAQEHPTGPYCLPALMEVALVCKHPYACAQNRGH